jgi:hypothetical protein
MCAQQHLATAAETANIQSYAFARGPLHARSRASRLDFQYLAHPDLCAYYLCGISRCEMPKTGVKAKEERTRKENDADDCCSQGVLTDIEAAVRMEKGCHASSCICPLAPDSIAYSRTRSRVSSRHASALTPSLPEKRCLRAGYHPDPCVY